MKIAFSLPVYWPAVGGCEFLTHELAHILAGRAGVDVRVVCQINEQKKKVLAPLWFNTTCHAGEKGRSYREDGVQVHLLGLSGLIRRSVYPFVRYHHRFQDLSMRFLVEAFRGQFAAAVRGANVVHCIHNGLSYYGILSLRVARRMRVPFVFSPTLHLYHEGWHEEMMRAVRAGEEFRYIPELHLRPRGYHDRFWMQVCHEADALVTWTDFERTFLADQGISPDKISSLKLGPIIARDSTTIDLTTTYGLRDDVPVVLFLGRNHELKGIEDLLQAATRVWSEIPETRFLFIGPKEGKSEEIFERYRDERVVVVDRVSDGEKAAFIKRCDVFCVPSLHESFGIVFLEAWHYGKPIIAADIPPIRELNPDGRGGFLIRPTPEGITEALLQLLGNPSLRREMGEWGRKRVECDYRWDKAGDRLLEIYGGLRSGRGWNRK